MSYPLSLVHLLLLFSLMSLLHSLPLPPPLIDLPWYYCLYLCTQMLPLLHWVRSFVSGFSLDSH